MIIKNEVELNQSSVDYVKETLSMYMEVDKLPKTIKHPILHLYPVKDTYDKNGNLNGYIDSLFFNVHVYDTENMTVFKGAKLHDGLIPFGDLSISQIKIFKDLSTMIVLRGEYNLSGSFAAFDISKAN